MIWRDSVEWSLSTMVTVTLRTSKLVIQGVMPIIISGNNTTNRITTPLRRICIHSFCRRDLNILKDLVASPHDPSPRGEGSEMPCLGVFVMFVSLCNCLTYFIVFPCCCLTYYFPLPLERGWGEAFPPWRGVRLRLF